MFPNQSKSGEYLVDQHLEIKEESLQSNEEWELSDTASIMGMATSAAQYRAVTVLTNLQRGNVRTEETAPLPPEQMWHNNAGMGELFELAYQEAVQAGRIDALDKKGMTALHWASYYGQVSTVEDLIKYGASIELESCDGETPLQLACDNGHHEIVKLLLNAGADPNHPDHMGVTPLMFAAYKNNPQCVGLLLDHKANLTTRNVGGENAYSAAVSKKSQAAVQVMDQYLLRCVNGLQT